MKQAEAFKALYDTIVKLRSPEGCPWDREQSPPTMRGALIEETYECIEAIDENDSEHIKEELGDLFLLATMIAYMHEQEGKFTVADSLANVNEKLIRRHPHVFGDVKVKDSAEVLDNWAAIKVRQEGRKAKDSILDEVSASLPPTDRAFKLQKKAAKAGFDWPDAEGVIAKIQEEMEEVKAEIAGDKEPGQNRDGLEEELGDLLFSVINLCRFLKVEPSVALRRTNAKFTQRFRYVEKKMKESGYQLSKENINIMEEYWTQAKKE
jgi:tetrapyrrole methylase family protein/MazG family protein